jgi:TonB family protein
MPMPNQEVKPATEETVQPVFGVTQDSVVAGDSPVAVPVGNTLMTKDRTIAKAPPPLPPAPPPPAFVPVDEDEVAEWPKELSKPTGVYPEAAARLGVGGRVLLKIGIDRKGNVKTARIIQKAGYGMDEEALKKIWHHKFAPAKRANGEPVDVYLTYGYRFDPPAL